MNTTTDPGDKSAREIEQEVDRSRHDLAAAVEALQNRFSAETILDDVVKAVSENGGEVARNLGRTMRDNPIPVLLTGVGLAWLMAGSNQPPARGARWSYGSDPAYAPDGGWSTNGVGDGPRGFARSPSGPARDAAGSVEDGGAGVAEKAGATASAVSHGASDAASAVSSSVSSMAERARDAVRGASETAGDLGHDARDRVNRAGRGAVDAGSDLAGRVEAFLLDQPLVAGALGFAAGLGLGALLPRTAAEDELLGLRSDALMASAQEMVGEQVDKAERITGAVLEEASTMAGEMIDEANRRTPEAGDLVGNAKSRVTEAVDRLKDAGADAVTDGDGGAAKADERVGHPR